MGYEKPVSYPIHLLQPVEGQGYQYYRIIGTGGIGSGVVFVLEGRETLRRNESRLGQLLPSRDYCKLHIVFHYVAALLSDLNKDFVGYRRVDKESIEVLPIGKVGTDESGQRLIAFMHKTGMDVRGVSIHPFEPTMYAVCIQYEDGSGGNIETSISASSQVSPEDIEDFFKDVPLLESPHHNDIVVALPEVPIETRLHLLRKGRERASLNVASCTSSEINLFREVGGFRITDVLSINMDEAAALVGDSGNLQNGKEIVEQCVKILTNDNPQISFTITDGANGSYGFMNGKLEFLPALKTEIVQTAGAGDAYLAGLICGLVCGLPLLKGTADTVFGENPLRSSMELGTILASLSLMSPHSIHETIDVALVRNYSSEFSHSENWERMLGLNRE